MCVRLKDDFKRRKVPFSELRQQHERHLSAEEKKKSLTKTRVDQF